MIPLFTPPFLSELEGSQSILIAGAGGGFDIFCALPLYHALRNAGKSVHLGNLSFSNLAVASGRVITGGLLEVTSRSTGDLRYFPELYLAQWFRLRGEEVPIYCFSKAGVVPLVRSYQALIDELAIDTVILIDGGTDSLMRGDESGLGTPVEDAASIAAVNELGLARTFLLCIGFGVDRYHGICHADFLDAVAELSRTNGFLGAWTLLHDMPEARFYEDAVRYVAQAMPHYPSIVSSSILSALEGRFGDHHATSRTAGSNLFINPLMTLYWSFRLPQVARRILYIDELRTTVSYGDVERVIENFRDTTVIRPWRDIPL